MQPVRIKCPGCSQILQAPGNAAGGSIRCPKCGTVMRVPAAPPQPTAPPVAPSPPPNPAPPPPETVAPRLSKPARAAADSPSPEEVAPRRSAGAARGREEPRGTDGPSGTGGESHFSGLPAELGEPLKAYLPPRYSLRLAIATGFFAVALILSLIGNSQRELVPPSPFGPPDAPPTYRLKWKRGIIAILNYSVLVGLVAMAYYLLFTLRTIKLRVVVCRNGFFYQHWGQRARCLWTDIESITHFQQKQSLLVFTWMTYYFQVIKRDQEVITFPSPINYLVGGMASSAGSNLIRLVCQIIVHILLRNTLPDIGGLCWSIRKQALEVLLPEMNAALDRGETISLGSVQMSLKGVNYQSLHPWDSIDLISVGGGTGITSGKLRLREKGSRGWAMEVHSIQVPNRDLLLSVAKRRYKIPIEDLDREREKDRE